MTDQATTPATAPQSPSSEAPTLNTDQTAAMRDAWVSAGHDPAEFDRAAVAPVQPVATPALAPDGSPIQTVSDMKIPSLSTHEALEMAQCLRDAGMSEARIQEALAADGVTSPAADLRTDAQREFDASFGAPDPSEYRVDYMGRGAESMDTADLAKLNAEATEWASAVGLPLGIGEAVIERTLDVGRWWSKASEVDRRLFSREQAASLIQASGGQKEAVARIELAKAAIFRGGTEFMQRLSDSGALHDAGIVMHLANQSERLAKRG